MKSWDNDIRFDDIFDYKLEADDHYINKPVETVYTPYDILSEFEKVKYRNGL